MPQFPVLEEMMLIFLPCFWMSGCKNATRAPNRSLAPISETSFTTSAAVHLAMSGHCIKSVVVSACLEITHVFLLERCYYRISAVFIKLYSLLCVNIGCSQRVRCGCWIVRSSEPGQNQAVHANADGTRLTVSAHDHPIE